MTRGKAPSDSSDETVAGADCADGPDIHRASANRQIARNEQCAIGTECQRYNVGLPGFVVAPTGAQLRLLVLKGLFHKLF
jgi:hypothetical protein